MAKIIAEDELTWRNHIKALANVQPLFSMLWSASPWLLIASVWLRLARGVVPVALLWVPKQIVDGILAASRGNGGMRQVWLLLMLEFALVVVSDLLSQVNTVVDSLLGEKFTCFVATQLIDHVGRLDLATLENPVLYDKLERVRAQATGRMFLLTCMMNIAQELLTLISLSASLIVFSPWLMVLVVASTIPTFIEEARFSRLSYSALFRRTPQRRELEYLRLLGSCLESAKEVRVFGLTSYLASKYRFLSDQIYTENQALSVRRAVRGWILGVVAVFGYYGGYVVVMKSALVGVISIGTFTFLTGSLSRSRTSTQRIFSYLNDISEQAVLLTDLFTILGIMPSICSAPNALPVPRPIRQGFEFCNVSFAYPGKDNLVVRNLNFRLRPSEKVALIGENGAGKTTIIKLLARLYDPVEGQILLDGIDLRNYDLADLRSTISVIFQDFMRYDLPVRENIAFGELGTLNDDGRLRTAARNGGAESVIDKMSHGYDQVLGRRFKNGINLSGGEWQKIALSRAFVKDAQILILDEPTASLDARAEDELFRRLRGQSSNPMVVMISHRLSMARIADNIIVLEYGEIAEQGAHAELVSLGGRYANLFNLQASAFLEYQTTLCRESK